MTNYGRTHVKEAGIISCFTCMLEQHTSTTPAEDSCAITDLPVPKIKKET
jgi:hypothetical protein